MKHIIDKYIRSEYGEDKYGEMERAEMTREQLLAHLSNLSINILQHLVDNESFYTSNGELVVDVQDIKADIKDLEK